MGEGVWTSVYSTSTGKERIAGAAGEDAQRAGAAEVEKGAQRGGLGPQRRKQPRARVGREVRQLQRLPPVRVRKIRPPPPQAASPRTSACSPDSVYTLCSCCSASTRHCTRMACNSATRGAAACAAKQMPR